ncbi:MAG: RNA degradosome polyphosphate kinase, partial [Candidatus Thiodiazotropha endolucinida]
MSQPDQVTIDTNSQTGNEVEPVSDIDLNDPSLYLNRELTWLAFNRRVLNEAEVEKNPLLERVKFLAIVSRNLDEFFMKRIGGLKQQLA